MANHQVTHITDHTIVEECELCQHSSVLEDILPSDSYIVITIKSFQRKYTSNTQAKASTFFYHFNIRAPPFNS